MSYYTDLFMCKEVGNGIKLSQIGKRTLKMSLHREQIPTNFLVISAITKAYRMNRVTFPECQRYYVLCLFQCDGVFRCVRCHRSFPSMACAGDSIYVVPQQQSPYNGSQKNLRYYSSTFRQEQTGQCKYKDNSFYDERRLRITLYYIMFYKHRIFRKSLYMASQISIEWKWDHHFLITSRLKTKQTSS